MGLYIREEGARLPIEASPSQSGLDSQREDVLKRLATAKRLIMLNVRFVGPGPLVVSLSDRSRGAPRLRRP
jgi:hypothetical protein